MSVYTFAKWKVRPGSLEEVLEMLKTVAIRTKKEPGNLLYKVHQAQGDQDTILLYEGYVDEAAVQIHRDSDYFQQIVIKGIVPLLENREVTLATEIDFLNS